MSPQFFIALIIGLAASAEDLWRRNISNWISLSALVAGFLWQAFERGWWGLPTAAGGAAAGFAVFLVFYLLGGMGGGDIKLMAGFGALLGASKLLEAAIFTAVLGAVLAIAVLATHAVRRAVGNKGLGTPRAIPYAPAIAAGVWLSLVPR
ncbi:MAG: prepilin peptidase [Candidatus Solibacter usitatus]|nr:prepilin peptidase [Candidatus Solibacter usitatus]